VMRLTSRGAVEAPGTIGGVAGGGPASQPVTPSAATTEIAIAASAVGRARAGRALAGLDDTARSL
jgi:hypothetical protein